MAHPIRTLVWLASALLLASSVRAAEPVNPSTEVWVGPAQIKAKIPGAGSPAGAVDFEILFGPNAGAGLDANEFHLIADDGMEAFDIFGTWTLDAKGQPVLALDNVLLADELSTLMVHICEDILVLDQSTCDLVASLDVVVDAAKTKFKVKTSAGAPSTLQLAGKIPFVLTDGGNPVKVSLSLKTSPPAELQP